MRRFDPSTPRTVSLEPANISENVAEVYEILPGMMVDMVPHERGDEVVAVVIKWLHAHGHGVPHTGRGRSKQLRFQLVVQKSVG